VTATWLPSMAGATEGLHPALSNQDGQTVTPDCARTAGRMVAQGQSADASVTRFFEELIDSGIHRITMNRGRFIA
jgi:hypothetical protein